MHGNDYVKIVTADGFALGVVKKKLHKGMPALFLLHGFTGSHHSWDALVPALSEHFKLLLVELPGHGIVRTPAEPVSFERLAAALATILPQYSHGQPARLCGYSMGGRIALHVALQHPDAVHSLALISASSGISGEDERAARRQADAKLAANIREHGMEWFVRYWENLPLFESQQRLPPAVREALNDQRLNCTPEGLAFALENFGTGNQDDLSSRLAELRMPLLLIAGGLDYKYRNAHYLMRSLAHRTKAQCVEIRDAGHAAHLEDPPSVTRALLDFFLPA